jgi:hypothetical protein
VVVVVAGDDLLQKLDQEGRQIDAAGGGPALGRAQPQFPGHLMQRSDIGVDEQAALPVWQLARDRPAGSPQRIPVQAAVMAMTWALRPPARPMRSLIWWTCVLLGIGLARRAGAPLPVVVRGSRRPWMGLCASMRSSTRRSAGSTAA